MIDGLFRAMFDGFFKDPKCQQHVKTMEEYLGRKIEFAYPPIGSPVKIFHYREALELLKENGIELEPFDDINTTNEKLLGIFFEVSWIFRSNCKIMPIEFY